MEERGDEKVCEKVCEGGWVCGVILRDRDEEGTITFAAQSLV